MRKALAFAFITVLMVAISSAADARGGKKGFGGGKFGGGKTFSVGKSFGGSKTFRGGKTVDGSKTNGNGKTFRGGKTVDGSKTNGSGKTFRGGKTVDGSKTNGSGKTADGNKTNGSGKTADSTETAESSKTADSSKTNVSSKTADSTETANGGNEECDYYGLTPGQAMQKCGSPDGRGASWYAHQKKERGRLIPEQTVNDASQDAGTGLTSDGAYRDPKTGLTYYDADGQTAQTSNGATYRTSPMHRFRDMLGSFVR